MPGVVAFGKSYINKMYIGEIDVLKSGCFVNPKSGNWCIGLASDYITFKTSDAIALELDANLIQGEYYQLTFSIYGNTSFNETLSGVIIGESIIGTDLGIIIDSLGPIAMNWKDISIEFRAQQNSKFITIKNGPGIKSWNQVDDFKINVITANINASVDSHELNVYPNPTKDYVFINTSDIFKVSQIKIWNYFGELISKTTDLLIDLSNEKSGAYLMEITTTKGSVYKIIIKK